MAIITQKWKLTQLFQCPESKVKRFLTLTYKPNNLILSGYKGNLEVNFPRKMGNSTSSKPGIITGNFLMDPLSQTLHPVKSLTVFLNRYHPLHVTDSEESLEKSSMATQSITAAIFQQRLCAPHCLRDVVETNFKKTEYCSSSKCVHIDGNETDAENSEVTVASETEESKDSAMKKVFPDDEFLLIKDNTEALLPKKVLERKTFRTEKYGK